MTKTFKKGDAVLVIDLWSSMRIDNRTGAVESEIQYYIQRAVVQSAGKKQMILNDATTGVFLGSNFKPSMHQGSNMSGAFWDGFSAMVIVPATLSDEDAVELARRCTRAYQAFTVKHIAQRGDAVPNDDHHANYIRAWGYATANHPVLEPIWKVAKDYSVAA